jgi:hypothetical protein
MEEGIETSWVIEGVGVRKACPLEDAPAWLDLPNNLKLLAESIVLD